MIASLIVLFGLLLFGNGAIETLVIDKQLNLIQKKRVKCCCCCTKTQAYDLKNVRNIRSFKKGHEGINHYTLHYTLQAEFHGDHAPIKIWDSNKESTISDKVS